MTKNKQPWLVCPRPWLCLLLKLTAFRWAFHRWKANKSRRSEQNLSCSISAWHMVFPVPGTLQLDHLQPLQPDLDWEFSIFPHTSYWGSPILLPMAPIVREKGILWTSEMDETKEFQCLGCSNWIISKLLSQFESENFSHFHFHAGEACHEKKWFSFRFRVGGEVRLT